MRRHAPRPLREEDFTHEERAIMAACEADETFVLTPKKSSFPLHASSYRKLWRTMDLLNVFRGGP